MKFALLCLVCMAASMAAVTETKVKLPNTRADLAAGEKLFSVHCALCHGPRRGRTRSHADPSETVSRT